MARKLKEVSEQELENMILGASTLKEHYAITRKYKLTENIIDKYLNKLGGWWEILRYQTLSEDYILKHENKHASYGGFHFYHVFVFQKLSDDFIMKHQHKCRDAWYALTYNKHHGIDFYEKYADKVIWKVVSKKKNLTEEFVEKYANKVHWKSIGASQPFSAEFMLKHLDKITWGSLVRNKNIPRDFFETHRDKSAKILSRDWQYIIRYQDISEETLDELQKKGKMVWNTLSLNVDMKKEFALKNFNKINVSYAKWNNKLNQDTKDEIIMIDKLSKG